MSTTELIAMAIFFVSSVGYYLFYPKHFSQSGLKAHPLDGFTSIGIFTLFAIGAILVTHYYVSPLPLRLTDKNPIWQIVLISALPQELLFRGTLLPWLQSKISTKYALLISSVIFSAIHVFIPEANITSSVVILALTFCGGLFWGWHMIKYQNLYLLIASHAIILMTFNVLN